MAAADVDVGYLAGHLGLDQPVLAALTTAPTVNLVSTLLQAVAAKAREFDALYADRLQKGIELENAVRSSESRSQSYKATADNALKEVRDARRKLQDEETKRQSVENELQMLRAKSADHAAEVKSLNDRVETLESSNRTNLSIIESNNKRDADLTDELTKQHQRNVELSRKIVALEQSEHGARSQLNSAKYREETLKHQLDAAIRHGEWLEAELKTKADEALKYRKERGARIAELQRDNDDVRSQLDALKRSEQKLRERLEAMQAKADDSLVKLQKQEATFATTVDSYKQELEDQRRLVDMSNQLSLKHQDRVRELEAEKERLRDNYDNEIRRLRLELEQERQTTADLEEKIRQLESTIDELHVRVDQGPAPAPASVPQTPRANGSVIGRAASPFGTPGSIRAKSAITATQAIEQLYQVKGQLATEKRRNQQLSEELDGMIAALEAKAPELQELQSEAETLRTEIARMSELSQQSFEERDAARRAARKAEAALANAQSEAKILKTQLRDLGTQIQMLVFNIYALEKGADQLTDEEKLRLEQLAKGEITEEALSDMSDTHQFITQKLVVFKDIQSLQAKNEDLLRINRELAEQIESEEALAAKHQAKVDHDQVERLKGELQHMTEEGRSMRITMESYKMERDMFRRILQQRGSGADEASMLRSSLDDSQRPPLASIEGDQTEALSEALRKLQSEYDHFRDAQDDVRKDLRAQIEHLSSEKNSLQTERIKLQADLRIESERREMLQSNYVALQSENAELQKRSQNLSETAAKQDIRTQQAAEELVETKGLIDSMRNETANLKAEKKLWKDIQDRMSRDNESLIEEKNRLNNLLATHQNLENERNRSEAEARRKAQDKIDSLERELSDTQRKLAKEAEESKRLQLRKEFEAKEFQKRIDELMTSLGNIREEHIGVKTTRDHLEARVNELTVELRNAEERVGRLQPQPTSRPEPPADGSQAQQALESEVQDLHNEIADLKRDLDLSNTQLENAKAQAEQYRELSQSNEEALEDLRASQDQSRQEMDSLIGERDAKIKELEQRVDDVSAELSRSNSELSSLRDSQGEVARRFEDEKAILQEELGRLKEEAARHAEAARYHQQDLRAQADIASKAQQDYEQELVKHAEAAKLAQQLRTECNELKSQAASLRAEAESAKVALAQSEGSWEERRQQLEQEMADLVARREDVNAQNKLLHQQLEGLTGQVAALQQKSRGGGEGDDEAMSPVLTGDALEGLRELNHYLRREKEILEVQYDVKTQEAKRLQQQVEYVQSQLDEARLKLDQERTQSAQGGRNSAAHRDLMEKLNELNLYRESSAALRTENARLKEQIADRNKKIEELESKVQPLEAEVANLGTQKSYLEEEIKQIQEDRDRWQKRTEGILTKYGRVDPAEMESLKKTVEEVEAERDALKQGEEPLRAKVGELESTLESERESWQTTRARLTDQFKERSKRLVTEKNEIFQQKNELKDRVAELTGELEEARRRVDEAEYAKLFFEKQVDSLKQNVQELRQQTQQAQPAQQPQAASKEVVSQLEQRLTDARKELEAVSAQKLGGEQQLERLRTEMQAVVAERDEAQQKLQEAAMSVPRDVSGAEEPPAAAQEAGSSQAQEADGGQAQGLTDEEKAALENKVQVAEAKAAEFEEKYNEVQQSFKERCDKMRDSLNVKLKESRGKMEEEFGKKEEDLKLRLEQEKLIWQAEKQAAKAGGPEQMPSTPAKDGPGRSVPATPALSDLAQLDDGEIRQFLASNSTAKSIIAANIKKKLEAESAKVKAEMDAKITAARDQAQLMESKKSILRINRAENRLKTAETKLGIVETAATETPEMAVAEVWKKVEEVKGPGGAGLGTPAKTDVAPAGEAAQKPDDAASSQSAPAPPAGQAEPAAKAAAEKPKPAAAPAQSLPPKPQPPESQQQARGMPAPKTKNPFAARPDAAVPDAPNPFAAKTGPTADAPQSQPQQQAQGAPKSGIPMPRGGGRGRGGTHGQPSQRGNQEFGPGQGPGQGGPNQGGRGRGRNLNPGAPEFQHGTKRPRGDSEAGRGGAKRARGGN